VAPHVSPITSCAGSDYTQVRARNRAIKEVADAALTMRDIDRDGLDEMDKRILEALVQKFNGAYFSRKARKPSVSPCDGIILCTVNISPRSRIFILECAWSETLVYNYTHEL
jgi:hypothetical protein